MTVSYQYEVASSTRGGFTRLLFMWRGSLYKLIYIELAIYLIIFGGISALYRNALSGDQKALFEKFVIYCDAFINYIPLSFVLGFYVAYVAQRWWQQYMAIPWPDKVMHSVALYVIGSDEYGRTLRRALMRYLNLSLILVLRSISSAVKRRFPTLDHVVDAGFMTHLELQLFESVPSLEFNTYWIPCTWFINLLKEARSSHRLPDPMGLKIIMEEFNEFRQKCGLLWSYDWVSIPLVYTQVVTLATYCFFLVALFGRQYIETQNETLKKGPQIETDIYIPAYTVLQFFFYMGLLKVAEQIINPFGDDDEDFELNWLIDRHVKVSYLGVDTLMNRCPPLVKDIYYDTENLVLPYTEAAAAYKRKTYRGSVANMTVPEEKQTMFLPNILEDDKKKPEGISPRASSFNLAVHNENFSRTDRRQGGSSPLPSRRLAHKPNETVVALEEPESQSLSSAAPAKSNGRSSSSSVFFDAMKKLSSKHKLMDRKPFLSTSKPSKVSIQPWPSATNLGVDDSLDQADVEADGKTHQTRSHNIPTIDIRRASVDANIDDEGVESIEMTDRRQSQAPRGAISRGFLFREQSVDGEHEPSCNSDHASSSDATAYRSKEHRRGQASTGAPRTRSSKSRKRLKALRFNSLPKFFSGRQRQPTVQRAGQRNEAFQSSTLNVSKSSPELTVDVELGTSNSGDRVRAKFFTGDDDEDEDDTVKKS
ncbi:bestrophin-4-like [Phymastichus coffea]|uniref:bestrophin-4-like n=1 Tax=Phymastichus coffea TaxID=108790 RepID=UPI00273BECB3|nr:bestrophin-4-like [Phymastichus coffea]